MEKILWLITARSGSKSIVDKNINRLGEFPLLYYRIKSALSIANSKDVWISTDSKKYAIIAEEAGATIPFIRPKELASDTSASIDVVLHALMHAKSIGLEYKYIGLLEPTSPFVYFKDLYHSYNLLENENDAEGIIAVKETRPNTFFIQDESKYLNIISKRINSVSKLGRQYFNPQITPSGGFYIAKTESLINNKTFYTPKTLSYLLPDECALEIDEPIDWMWAEFLLNQGVIEIQKIFT